MVRRVVAGAATAAFVLLLVSCGLANLFEEDPAVWPAYQDGYAAGAQYQGARSAPDDCHRLGSDRYANTGSPEALAFTAGCADAADSIPMQSEEAIQNGYSDIPHGD